MWGCGGPAELRGTCSEDSNGEVTPPLSACVLLLLLLRGRILEKSCLGDDFDLLWGCPFGEKSGGGKQLKCEEKCTSTCLDEPVPDDAVMQCSPTASSH